MTEQKKPIKYDLSGYESITSALLALINLYPALVDGDEIAFSQLEEASGKAIFPISGAVIQTEIEDITGHVTQTCLYPFMVVYRTSALSEARKVKVKQWLDDLGKWLEMQPINVSGVDYHLTEYPVLASGQSFVTIVRQTPAYLEGVNKNQSEDWQIYISATYKNEFDR